MKNILLFIALSLLLSAQLHAQTEIKIRIDPENSRGASGYQIFDSVRFIPLETTRESLFGSVGQLEITDSLFIIYDRMNYTILLFTRDGKFVKKIAKSGKDRYLSHFSIIPDSNQIAAVSLSENKLYIYNFDGVLIRTEPVPLNTFSQFHFNANNALYYLRRFNDDGTFAKARYDLAFADSTGKVTRYLHPFPDGLNTPEFSFIENPVNFSGEAGSCIFSLPFEYEAYLINDTGVTTKFSFIFPAKISLPDNFAYDTSYNGKRVNYIYYSSEHDEELRGINSIYKVADYLLFSTESGIRRIDTERNFLYSLNTGNVYSFKKLTPDSTTGNLLFLNTALDNVQGTYKNQLFTSIPSGRILTQVKNQDKKLIYPESLNKLINSGTKMDNPVIVQFKLRENL